MTYATATMNLCAANDNLSAAIDHYKTHNDLCLTDMDTYRACDNLSTAANPNTIYKKPVSVPISILARPMHIPYDPTTIFGTAVEPTGTCTSLPSGRHQA